MTADARPDDEAWFPRRLGPLLLAATFVALVRWSWRQWPDVLLDFGSQLYIPWQLAEGRALYLDIDYKDGPLSQYVNALWFTLFGVSLSTIIWCNLGLLAVLCGLVYRMMARACGRGTATLAVFVQLVVFSFSQYTVVANYNYVCPYAQEQTHGLLLAVAMITALGACAERGRARFAALAGLALGLTALTKAELSLPALVVGVFGLGLVALTRTDVTAPLSQLGAAFAAGAVLPVLACVALLATQMPWTLALRGAAGNWTHLGGDIVGYEFYRVGMGLDDPAGNVGRALTVFAAMAGVVGLAVVAAVATRGLRRGGLPVGLAAAVGLGAALFAGLSTTAWSQVGRALPITAAFGVLVFTWRVVARRHDPAAAAPAVPLALFALFALLLLGKVVLAVRISHYGFVLALPATLVLIATLVHVVPSALAARGANATVARALLATPVLVGTLVFFQWSDKVYADKNTVVGRGGDALVAADVDVDVRGEDMQRAAERLGAMMPPGATLMTIPDGLMLNYWLRRANPSRHIYFVPWSLAFAGGEAVVLADIQRHPPDFIAVVHRSAEEYGFTYFGADERFGGPIRRWVRANYRRIEVIRREPFTDRGFGIMLMSYNPPPPS